MVWLFFKSKQNWEISSGNWFWGINWKRVLAGNTAHTQPLSGMETVEIIVWDDEDARYMGHNSLEAKPFRLWITGLGGRSKQDRQMLTVHMSHRARYIPSVHASSRLQNLHLALFLCIFSRYAHTSERVAITCCNTNTVGVGTNTTISNNSCRCPVHATDCEVWLAARCLIQR